MIRFLLTDRMTLNHDDFTDEHTHIKSLPNPVNVSNLRYELIRRLTSIDLVDIGKNVSTTNVNVPLEDDQSSLFAYVVWIFLAFLTYPVDFPDCEDSRARSIHKSFTSSASFWESSIQI
ncbi:hypothetical protein Tco_0968171 [Tanacetum coccineum]